VALPVVISAALLMAGIAAPLHIRADRQIPQPVATTPFEHSRHESIGCNRCHGTGERHRTLLLRTPQDCLACHHDAARAADCTACHERARLPEPGTVTTALELSVRAEVQPRALPFGHELHARVDCRDCHRTPVTLAMDRTCGSCHAEHHTAAAECQSCHVSPEPAVHDASAHLSCSGGGCHAALAAPSPILSRSLCLVCHDAQRNHEPEGDCARCHRIPDPEPLPAGGAASERGRR
jgi:hypothetical protein